MGKQFIELAHSKKGFFYSINKQLVAVLEKSFCFVVEGVERCSTIWHVNCNLLLVEDKITCTVCINYCNTLQALTSKISQSKMMCLQINTWFLRTPQRIAHLTSFHRAIRNNNRQLRWLWEKIQLLLKDSIPVDKELSSDIQKIVDQHKVVENDFRHIFWEQQVSFQCFSVAWWFGYLKFQVSACKARKTGIRWKPLFVHILVSQYNAYF